MLQTFFIVFALQGIAAAVGGKWYHTRRLVSWLLLVVLCPLETGKLAQKRSLSRECPTADNDSTWYMIGFKAFYPKSLVILEPQAVYRVRSISFFFTLMYPTRFFTWPSLAALRYVY